MPKDWKVSIVGALASVARGANDRLNGGTDGVEGLANRALASSQVGIGGLYADLDLDVVIVSGSVGSNGNRIPRCLLFGQKWPEQACPLETVRRTPTQVRALAEELEAKEILRTEEGDVVLVCDDAFVAIGDPVPHGLNRDHRRWSRDDEETYRLNLESGQSRARQVGLL